MSVKTITVTYHINEETGKVIRVSKGKEDPQGDAGEQAIPSGKITDTCAAVIAHNSPSCIYIPIGGTWVCFC